MPTSNFITSEPDATTLESTSADASSVEFPTTQSPGTHPPDWLRSVSLAEYDANQAPPSRFRRFATPYGLMPKWLLALAWIGLGGPTMALAVYTIAALFLTNTKPTTPSGEVNHELLLLICVSLIVNFCALVLFSILGRETARHRRSRRRRQWER